MDVSLIVDSLLEGLLALSYGLDQDLGLLLLVQLLLAVGYELPA